MKKLLRTDFLVIRTFLTAIFFWLFNYSISYAQIGHEIHLGFSSLRTWKINPSENIIQNLDYYLSPNIGYDLHLRDNLVVLGVRLGSIYEKKNTVEKTNEYTMTTDEKRKSYFSEIRVGYNFLKLNRSYFQLAGSLRYVQVYYFDLVSFTQYADNSTGGISANLDSRISPNIDYGLALAYQYDTSKKRRFRKQSLGIRIALEMSYMTPRKHFYIGEENRLSSISFGPSISVVWRFNDYRTRVF